MYKKIQLWSNYSGSLPPGDLFTFKWVLFLIITPVVYSCCTTAGVLLLRSVCFYTLSTTTYIQAHVTQPLQSESLQLLIDDESEYWAMPCEHHYTNIHHTAQKWSTFGYTRTACGFSFYKSLTPFLFWHDPMLLFRLWNKKMEHSAEEDLIVLTVMKVLSGNQLKNCKRGSNKTLTLMLIKQKSMFCIYT